MRDTWRKSLVWILAAVLCLLSWAGAEELSDNMTGFGSGRVYSVRKKADGGYDLWVGDRRIGDLPGTEELFGMVGGEELILLTNENVTGLGSDLQWVQEYLQGENITGTGIRSDLQWVEEYLQGDNLSGTGSGEGAGSGGGTGAVYGVRKEANGGYGLWIGGRQIGELPGMEELFGMIGGEELILLTNENVTGFGSGLQWVLDYLQGENITGTGSGGGAGLSGGTGEVYVVRNKDGSGYELRRGDSLIREFPGTGEVFGLTGEEELIVLTNENVTGLGSDLQWVQEYLQGDNITGMGSGDGAGFGGGTAPVYVVRNKDGGGSELWFGGRLIRELPEGEELFGLTGEEELILLTGENVTGLGSDLLWMQDYLQGGNISGTGAGDPADYGTRPTRLEDLLNQTVPENSIYVQDNLGSGR
ncbi:MAG: hypothetical protein J6U01_05210 [Clostridia bacterium]|nr:hypothetical protein [Clostridia bacterium]